ncbi:MAG: translation initiation factor IF-5A [Candidatus Woesearchaeota archaeon]
MDTTQISVGSLKVGRYVVFDGKPYVVKSIQTSRTGKHGHAKCRIEAVNLFDGNKVIKAMPAHDNVDTPIIDKKNAQVLSVVGKTANVMDMETYETFDLEVPEEMKGAVDEGSTVMYWTVLGKKVMKQK